MPITLEQIRAGKGAAPRRPPPSAVDRLKSFAWDAAEIPLAAVSKIGDYSERPQLALSEMYGAIDSGEENVLTAGYRGFTEGGEGREYPTFGERIVPHEEDEGMGRKLMRFGAEMVTDPANLLLYGPVARGVGRVGLKGARMVKASRAGKAVADSQAAQTMARLVMSSKYNLETWGREFGEEVATRSGYSTKRSSKLIEEEMLSFRDKVKSLGLFGARQADRRKLVAGVLESDLKKWSGDAEVDELAVYLKSRFDEIGGQAEGFIDDFGEKIMVNVDGKKVPFSRSNPELRAHPGYYPHAFTNEFIQQAMSKKGLSNAAKELAKRQNITMKEAESILKAHTGRAKVAGHVERPQLVPSEQMLELLERDPGVVFPMYVTQVHQRLETARQFGLDGRRLTGLLDNAVGAGLSEKTAQTVRQAITGQYVESAFGLDVLGPKIMAFQVLSKMGPTSALANLSQQTNILVADGIGNYVRGLYRLATDQGVRQRSLEAFQIGMRSQLDMLVGGTGAGSMPERMATKWLGLSLFTGAEQANRMVAYAGGLASAEQMALKAIRRGGGKIPENLNKLLALGKEQNPRVKQLIEAEWLNFRRTRKFTPEFEREIGLAAANNTQFTTKFMDLPPMWRTPEMRLAMQFRGFIYQQSRFLAREVVTPAMKWIDTGGKEGSIGPALRALALYPIAGHGVAGAREMYSEMWANRLGIKRRFKRSTDSRRAIQQMLEDSLFVGTFGMAGDMLDQAADGDLLNWAVGPTASGLAYAGEKGLGGAKKMLFEGDYPGLEDVVREGIRMVPGRRGIPLAPSELAERITRKK